MGKLNPGDRVTVTGPPRSAQLGREGTVSAIAPCGDVYPQNLRPVEKGKKPKKPPDPAKEIVTVQLDGESRPRNFPAGVLKGGE